MNHRSSTRGVLTVLIALLTVGTSCSVLSGTAASGPTHIATSLPPLNTSIATHAPRASLADSGALSADAQRILSITRTLEKGGGLPGPIHLPDLAAESVNKVGVVGPTYAQAPAPMGVADIGVHNVSGALRGYTMYTESALGQITLNNASSVYIDGDGADMFGIQLNTVLANVTISGNSSYQFWTQNFVSYTPSSGWLVFGDNVWNFSSRSGNFPANSLLLPRTEWNARRFDRLPRVRSVVHDPLSVHGHLLQQREPRGGPLRPLLQLYRLERHHGPLGVVRLRRLQFEPDSTGRVGAPPGLPGQRPIVRPGRTHQRH